jgi:hypothetical protein
MRALGFLLIALAGVMAFEGCGSSESTGSSYKQLDGGADTCNIRFCSNNGGVGKVCCAGTQCGFNFGNGCVPTHHIDGGP